MSYNKLLNKETLIRMKSLAQHKEKQNHLEGNVYVMTHSFFSDVIKIGCTVEDPNFHAKSLSAKTFGEYTLAFSLRCKNPKKVEKRIQSQLLAQKYTNDFYHVSVKAAERLLKREAYLIPILNKS